jgi:hypothetical protein
VIDCDRTNRSANDARRAQRERETFSGDGSDGTFGMHVRSPSRNGLFEKTAFVDDYFCAPGLEHA